METLYRPLTEVKEFIEDAGYTISYLYEDIIFVSHNAFIILYDDDNAKTLKLYFNIDCEKNQIPEIIENITINAKKKKYKIIHSGNYTLKEKLESKELEIVFLPN